MKTQSNQSPRASHQVLLRAKQLGVPGSILTRAKPRHRRYDARGSTASPQKVVVLNNIRMSLAQARQYLDACSRRMTNV